MKKRILGLLMLIVFYGLSSTAQTIQTKTYSNEESMKLSHMLVASSTVILPDSLNTILKDFSFTSGIPLPVVIKQSALLKMIYNQNFTKEERLYAAEYLLSIFSKPGSGLPIFLVNDVKTKLSSSK